MPIRSDEECVYRSWRGIVCPDGSWEGVTDGSCEIFSVGPGGALFRASLGEVFFRTGAWRLQEARTRPYLCVFPGRPVEAFVFVEELK